MARTPTSAATSTAQQLGSNINSARDLMRKDKGLNGDLDRLPMLTWILFLKFLDDLERARGGGAARGAAILPPYERTLHTPDYMGGQRDSSRCTLAPTMLSCACSVIGWASMATQQSADAYNGV